MFISHCLNFFVGFSVISLFAIISFSEGACQQEANVCSFKFCSLKFCFAGEAAKQYGYAPSSYGPGYGTNGGEARAFEERVSFPLVASATDDKHHLRWRDPNLAEVIGFLSNSNNVIKANAAAYLQHLCYMDDPNKQKTRSLGGIPPLVKLLSNESSDVCRNACGALRYARNFDKIPKMLNRSR